jgi:hypothetical protein
MRVAREVAVVDGNDVATTPWFVNECRVGINALYFSMTSAPSPSTRNKTSLPCGDSPNDKVSSALVRPRPAKIEGVIWAKCMFVSCHEV